MYTAVLRAEFWITVYVLGLPTFEDTMPWMYVILIAAANLLFLLYDRILSRLRWFYREIFVRRVLGRKR